MDGPPPPALVISGLAVRRGGRLIFRRLDLDLAAGDLVVITGPNGSGKTSLLRILAGLLPPAEGRIEWQGESAADILAEDCHYAGHALALTGAFSVRRNLLFWRDYLGGAREAVEDALEAFDLAPLADLPVRALSEGQRRRVSLARLVLARRPLWLLDEPTVAIDAASEKRLYALLNRHLAEGGMALVATHRPIALVGRSLDMTSVAAGVADRAAAQ